MLKKIKYLIYSYLVKFFLLKKTVQIGDKFRLLGKTKFILKPNSSLIIGNKVFIVSGNTINPLGRNIISCLRVDEGAILKIGNNVGMSCVSIWSSKKIIIGDNVKLGGDVMIFDSDMHSLDYVERRNYETDAVNAKKQPIIIGNDVFIGTRSIITKGVQIGDRSIVASGSIVVKNIPKDEIWGGNPAKFIKKISN
jgi:acetyltransferase-like isoleucine patch superfamily enzyme